MPVTTSHISASNGAQITGSVDIRSSGSCTTGSTPALKVRGFGSMNMYGNPYTIEEDVCVSANHYVLLYAPVTIASGSTTTILSGSVVKAITFADIQF